MQSCQPFTRRHWSYCRMELGIVKSDGSYVTLSVLFWRLATCAMGYLQRQRSHHRQQVFKWRTTRCNGLKSKKTTSLCMIYCFCVHWWLDYTFPKSSSLPLTYISTILQTSVPYLQFRRPGCNEHQQASTGLLLQHRASLVDPTIAQVRRWIGIVGCGVIDRVWAAPERQLLNLSYLFSPRYNEYRVIGKAVVIST